MKNKTPKKPFLEEHREGFAMDEMHRKMDIVLEHVVGLTEKAKEHDDRFDAVDQKLEVMTIKLAGKIDQRVTRLEHART